MEERKVKISNLIMYGMGDFFGGGSFLIIGMLYLFFLTEVVGLTPVLASAVFAIGKVWDAVSDPLMGYISDNTRSKLGRRRIYLLIGITPIALSFILMWLPVGFGSTIALFFYYSFAYILFSTVFTMVMVPYAALNAEMTTDYKVRTRMSGVRIVFSQFSALLAGTLPKIIINQFTPEQQTTGYLIMAVVFGVLYATPWIFVFLGTWELPYKKNKIKKHSPLAIFSNFGSIFKNKSFRIHIAMYICAYSAMDILMAMFAYYLTYYLDRPELYSVAMGALLITQMAMLAVYVIVANKKGKGFAYIM
ncbi:MAG: MFS transporter, partial [Spirochaetia bacterium]